MSIVRGKVIDQNFLPSPLTNEHPCAYADRLGQLYSEKVSPNHKKDWGQFFTPSAVAAYMSTFADVTGSRLRILDPGCGTGILSCAVIESIIAKNPAIKQLELVAFENENGLLDFTDASLEYLAKWVREQKISFLYYLCKNDFVMHNSATLIGENSNYGTFDIIIANPPYFKLKKNDERSLIARSVMYGQANIYSIFLYISSCLLNAGGQLIFITPRSFTSGNYFKSFREKFLSLVNLTQIHLFLSRKEAFERDKVLQENIIVSARRKPPENPDQMLLPFAKTFEINRLLISTSTGISDVHMRREKNYLLSDLVNIESDQKIIHIPSSENDEIAIDLFKTWTTTLCNLDMQVSTGPVVDFRSLEYIKEKYEPNSVPMIYLHNINKMKFVWPNDKTRGKRKGAYIVQREESSGRLVPNKDYVLLRRFSSKDDKSRLVAAPYFSKWQPDYTAIGIENHLNYIYRKNGELSNFEVLGISGLLNSRLFDLYFRTFNGNINVSATELRHMPLPDKEDILEIGERLAKFTVHNQQVLDTSIEQHFKISFQE